MKVYLIEMHDREEKQDELDTKTRIDTAIAEVSDLMSDPDRELLRITCVDTVTLLAVRMEPAIEKNKIVLKEVQAEA